MHADRLTTKAEMSLAGIMATEDNGKGDTLIRVLHVLFWRS